MPGEIVVYSLKFFLVVLTIFIIVIEVYVLKWLKYGSLRHSLAISLLMNVISTGIAYLVATTINETGLFLYYPLHVGYMITVPLFSAQDPEFSTLPVTSLFLAVSYLISVLSEGVILQLLGKRHPAKTIWRMVLAANGVSHVFLFILYLLIFLNRTLNP